MAQDSNQGNRSAGADDELTLAPNAALGLLKFATDGLSPRSSEMAGSIRVYPDGPLLVRGDVAILDETGDPIPVTRTTISLCRCGRSRLAPFCDGSHARSPGPRRLG